MKPPLTIEQVIEAIQKDYYLVPRKEMIGNFDKFDYINKVVNFIATFKGTGLNSLKSASRQRDYVEARYFIYYIIEKHSKVIIEKQHIGSILNRDRTTIHLGLAKCHDLIQSNKAFRLQIQQCEQAFLEYHGK